MPLSNPKEMTVRASIGLGSKKRSRCATYSVKKVTIKCQLVSVVAKKKPRVLMRYLLQMTMATDEVTERLSAPATPIREPPPSDISFPSPPAAGDFPVAALEDPFICLCIYPRAVLLPGKPSTDRISWRGRRRERGEGGREANSRRLFSSPPRREGGAEGTAGFWSRLISPCVLCGIGGVAGGGGGDGKRRRRGGPGENGG
jgi:hypothetical protein